MRGKLRASPAELHAREQAAARGKWHEDVPIGAQSRVAVAELDRELPRRVAPHREAFAAPPERQRRRREIAVRNRWIGTIPPRRGVGMHAQRGDAFASRREAPLAARADAFAHRGPHAARPIVIAVVVAEFLRGDRIEERRDHRNVADVAHLAIGAQLEAVGGGDGDVDLAAAVREAIAAERPELVPVVARAQDKPRARGETFDAIYVQQLAQGARTQALAFQTAERAATHDAAHLGTDALQVVLADGLGDVLDGGGERYAPGEGVAYRLRRNGDLLAREETRREADVELVAVELPAAADDAARGNVEPRGAAPDLDFLAIRQPKPPFPQRVVEHDADVFELRIEVRLRREVERHADQVGGREIDEQGADDRPFVETLGPHAQRDDAHGALGQDDRGRVAEREVVERRPARRERMRYIAHLVALAQADGAAEIVLDDAEVVAVIVDVGGKLGAIAPADDPLLAEAGRLPVHFQLQLVGFDESRRLGEPFAKLPEEEEKPVSFGCVIAQRGIDGGVRPAIDRPLRQRDRGVAVPVLRAGRHGPAHRADEHNTMQPPHRRPI